MSDAPTCRSCGSAVEIVLDLGLTPVADLLLTKDQLDDPEPAFPLVVGFCTSCALLALVDLLAQDELYTSDYPYYTSEVPGLIEHFGASARSLLESCDLRDDSLVIEAASNDGYMLRIFAEASIPVLGVDPAPGPAEVAEGVGVPTIVDFFSAEVARRIVDEGRRCDLLLGNNVLNLVPDPDDFARAVDLLLTEDGTVVLEIPYLLDTLDDGAYDNFFHQNSSYFSLTATQRLFGRHGLGVSDVERISTFGGSLRVTLTRGAEPSEAVLALAADEEGRGVKAPGLYRDFARRARESRDELVGLLTLLVSEGRSIVAYGAAGGMATTLVSFADIDSSVIEYAVDANPHKHGWYTPGSHLLIRPAEVLSEEQPDVVLLLAWNYADAVLEAQSAYRAAGGKFLIPIPHPHMV